MMKTITLTKWFIALMIFTLPAAIHPAYAQPYYNERPEYIKANSQWALNLDNGLNFNTDPPSMFNTSSNGVFGFSGSEGFASVADPITGALLFYTDGERVWNANNQVMQNGDSLSGNTQNTPIYGYWYGDGGSTTQGACIVPFIDEPGKYYLFSLAGPTTSWFGGDPSFIPPDTPFLYYSVVDMSLDGGMGAIVSGQKNIPLGGNIPLSEAMIAIPGNSCDIWLMVHDASNPVFKAFHITKQGVDTNAVESVTTSLYTSTAGLVSYAIGGMAISPNREMIAIVNGNALSLGTGIDYNSGFSSATLLCRFDAATGIVSDAMGVGIGILPYMLAFSPDNTKLYMSAMLNFNNTSSPLLQYDVSSSDSLTIAGSQQIIASASMISPLKSYDGKIYWCSYTNGIGIINQPNLAGIACDVADTAYPFSSFCLPNDVVYAYPPDTIITKIDTSFCFQGDVPDSFALTAPSGFYTYIWDDSSTDSVRTINTSGVYWVMAKDSCDCHFTIDTFVVHAFDNIPLNLGADTTLCKGEALSINLDVSGADFKWQDSSANSSYTITDSGQYWVRVSRNGCTVADTILVNVIDLQQDLGDSISICHGTPVQVYLGAYVPSGANTLWNTGETTSQIIATDTGWYYVSVIKPPCVDTDSVYIDLEWCHCFFQVPSAFSPNGDGLNDEFRPVAESIDCPTQGYRLHIYNRWGEMVYVSHKISEGWNGLIKGRAADAGVYFYEMKFEGGTDQIPFYQKGDITLIR